MPVNRSTRTLLAAGFLIAALFVAMDYAVESTPLLGWWLPLLLLVVALALVLSTRIGPAEESLSAAAVSSTIHEYDFPELAALTSPGPEEPGEINVREPASEAVAKEEAAVAPATSSPAAEVELNTPTLDAEPEAIAPSAEFANLDTVISDSESETTAESIPSASTSSSTTDDLTVIHGIGPKIATSLRAAGIDSFTKLAGASDADLDSAIRARGVRLAPTLTTWREQAAYLASGDRDGFESLRRKLTQGGIESGD